MKENIDFSKNAELNEVLKKFEEKSSIEQIQVQKASENLKDEEIPKMTRYIMKLLDLQEQKQAEYVLLGFLIVIFGISLFVFFGGSPKKVDLSDPSMQPLSSPLE